MEETPSFFIVASTRTRVIENDGRRWFSKEPAVSFFSKDKWFNVIAMIKQEGIIYYINIASPTIVSDGMLRYIDYDLDFKLYPDGRIVTLDEGEHARHCNQYQYSPELKKVIQLAGAHIMTLLKSKSYPFDDKLIKDIYQKFLIESATRTTF
jgi:protein associated with RNAse G/E